MKKIRRISLIFISAIFMFGPWHACFSADNSSHVGANNYSPLHIQATVDKRAIAIGERIKYNIRVSTDKNTEVEFVNPGKDLGNFRIRGTGSKTANIFGKKDIVKWYVLDTFVTGKQTIPRLTIKYRQAGTSDWSSAEIPGQAVEVKSMLDKFGKNAALRDIKPPVSLRSPFIFYIILTLVFLIISICIAVFFLKKKTEKQKPRLKLAHEIAYEQLEELRNMGLLHQGKIKEYFIRISDIIRRYLENRFNLRAPEMTTEEFLNYVKDSERLSKEHKELLKEFLLCCDLVKFAKYAPSAKEIDSVFDSAKRFIDQTKEENVIS